jgi:acetyl-CoA carboxylase biotin carboxyl carrier protein
VTSRLHGTVMTAVANDQHELRVPAVGVWRPSVAAGQVVQTGDTLGELTVLGVVYRVVAGPGVRGAVVDRGARGPRSVDAATALFVVDPAALVSAGASEAGGAAAAAAKGGLAVCAPSSGRFYGRPGPGKPAFVSPGDVIKEGHTVCLLEVMKTFHRVTYGGAGLPPEARVVAIAVADEADVNSGDVLVRVEAISP